MAGSGEGGNRWGVEWGRCREARGGGGERWDKGGKRGAGGRRVKRICYVLTKIRVQEGLLEVLRRTSEGNGGRKEVKGGMRKDE